MNIAVIGTGYVGLVTGTCLASKGHKVVCVDVDKKKIAALKLGKIPIYEPGLPELVRKGLKSKNLSFANNLTKSILPATVIFIAVGTPPKDDGSADLSYIEQVAREIAINIKDYKVIVEKSTVPVETGQRVSEIFKNYSVRGVPFDVVSNPEFLREGQAILDFMHPDRIVIGTESHKAEKIMRSLYASFSTPIIVTDIKSAEIIKHASNSFLATKISFINMISALCEEVGADIEKVAEGIGLDKRIGRSFLYAGLGYGGSCFPKDVSAFIKIAAQYNLDFGLLEKVAEINTGQINRFLAKIEQALWVIKGKKIAVLGLAFKPETDDIRQAPAIKIVERLLAEGAKISAYDPEAMKNFQTIFKPSKDINYARDPYQACKGADAICILTEWEEFKKLNLVRIKKLAHQPIIIDGRNIFTPQEARKLGFHYFSIGRA